MSHKATGKEGSINCTPNECDADPQGHLEDGNLNVKIESIRLSFAASHVVEEKIIEAVTIMSESKSAQLSDIQEIDDKMDSEDQFCLQWNDHKSTLVTVFESLLESGTLVDCSLAAEGQFLKAHKVVLSACSPYFELLFSEHKEKHPILILKDVKFQELKALMDYMYRGEVNIPQDRLRALLETAESLQIKGLGGCKTGLESPRSRRNSDSVDVPSSSALSRIARAGADASQNAQDGSLMNARKGNDSPIPRKRSRHHLHTSAEEETSSRAQTSDSFEKRSDISSRTCPPAPPHPTPKVDVTVVPSTPAPVSSALSSGGSTTISAIRREWAAREVEGSSSPMQGNVLSRTDLSSGSQSDMKPEPTVEILLTPKTEYVEDVGDEDTRENSIVLDDADYMAEPRSGPSHAEDGSSNQGPGKLVGIPIDLWQRIGETAEEEDKLGCDLAKKARSSELMFAEMECYSFAPWLSVAEWAADDVVPPHAVGTFRDPPEALQPKEDNLCYMNKN
ncbi:Longitudinals lacking protein, isoforms H/M/V [Gryllus bimaculatus]|nr:Longitudinals lacking protein, isoforms H/M/V [Gryllus bimaculatus]